MRVVIQRVSTASVTVDGRVTGQIGRGLLLLVGVGPGDTPEVAQVMATKIARLRLFADEVGKMNRALSEVSGSVLSVSQFTLYADTRRGNRPSFTGAAGAEQGQALYRAFNTALRSLGHQVEEGVFGADMHVALVNDGPVTILLDSERP